MKLDWDIDKTWTLFLDRDGVINERVFGGYILQTKDFVFKEGVLESASSLFGKFGKVFIVTNQQCIGKALITEVELDAIHNWMCKKFSENKARINAVFVAGELKNTVPSRRKPSIEMGLDAKGKYPEIDFSKSIMVGDTDSDLEFGLKLGMKTVLIESEERCDLSPNIKLASLTDFNKML
ncbi:MAG: HAD-IIIA family hydrolase [Crocinitomicaceae bacterium]|jgi:D-glycero-D-manno-heptose 1,7-bisphosphate phosphatase|nr:HAD-IIIA family hydrolase [Crocinitomicaceae bacterium]